MLPTRCYISSGEDSNIFSVVVIVVERISILPDFVFPNPMDVTRTAGMWAILAAGQMILVAPYQRR